MTPSKGRIVLYKDENGTDQPAIVTMVWAETCVNLTVFPDGGTPYCRGSVMQDELGGCYMSWRWPPRVETTASGGSSPQQVTPIMGTQ